MRSCERFGSVLEAEQHAPRHEKRRGLDDTHEHPGADGRWDAHAIARHESCPFLVERVQAELPGPREAVACAAQDEYSIWLDGSHWESLTASNGNLVTHG